MINKRVNILLRVYTVFLIILVAGLAVGWQAFQIQYVQGEELIARSDSLIVSTKNLEAERGNIYSSNGALLSTSIPLFDVRIDFRSERLLMRSSKDIEKRLDSLSVKLAETDAGNTSASTYYRRLLKAYQSGNRYTYVRNNVSYPELKEMKTWPFFNMGRFASGRIFIQKNRRITPFGKLAHRTIGYVRSDDGDTIAVGLEGFFNEQLAGERGRILVQRISQNTYIPLEGADDISPRPGFDLYTTIDIHYQDIVETVLENTLEKHDASHGTAVLMEVSTGKIKAIANLSNINNEYEEYYNHAVGAATEPGSTFKLASVAALLEDGFASLGDKVDLEGGEKAFADNAIMRDAKVPDEEKVTLQKAFEVSSNVGISKMIVNAYSHRGDRFYNRMEAFGLTRPVGVEIKGEPNPVIPGPSTWSTTTLPWMSIGYEVSLTPLQMLNFYNTIANNGQMMKPYLVASVREYDRVVKTFEPTTIATGVVKESTAAELRKLLRGVVERGTAQNINSSRLPLAGKTGTSRIANERISYSDKKYQASFAGFFPADEPKFSCIVLITDPKEDGFYGNQVAAPAFQEIAEQIHATMPGSAVQPESETIEKFPYPTVMQREDASQLYAALGISYHTQANSEYTRMEQRQQALTGEAFITHAGEVPSVVGMDLSDALYVLENLGFTVVPSGIGKVIKQWPEPGPYAGKTVNLQLK